MILDFQQVSPVGGIITFPDVVAPSQPTDPDDLLETAVIPASSITTISMGGSVDSPG